MEIIRRTQPQPAGARTATQEPMTARWTSGSDAKEMGGSGGAGTNPEQLLPPVIPPAFLAP